MYFYGISIRPHWFRWLYCAVDDTYVASDPFGNAMLMTKKVPQEAYFPRFGGKDA